MKLGFQHCINIILLAIFGGYWISITMCGHVHEVNGATIVHSHPFSSDDGHQHANSTIITISTITNFIVDLTDNISIPDICHINVARDSFIYVPFHILSPCNGIAGLRAPPLFFS